MKKVNRLLQTTLFSAVLVSAPLQVMAQQTTVKGSVSDSKGEPLIGVTVMMKGHTNIATVTDMDGNFVLSVPNPKAVLEFSYVGMQNAKVELKGRQTIKLTMHDDEHTMDEVIVVGYGQQKKASVVGSITQTSGKTLERAGGVSSIGAALTGNLPGVVTMSSTGMPGEEDPKIVIRGVSSWNNSEPLVLVDGIERPMNSVDISSVQNVSVLKDASATAVYGVRGDRKSVV